MDFVNINILHLRMLFVLLLQVSDMVVMHFLQYLLELSVELVDHGYLLGVVLVDLL